MRTLSRYSCCNRRKGGGKTVIAMYTCKDNLTPLLYSGKIKKIKKNKKKKSKVVIAREFLSSLRSCLLRLRLRTITTAGFQGYNL